METSKDLDCLAKNTRQRKVSGASTDYTNMADNGNSKMKDGLMAIHRNQVSDANVNNNSDYTQEVLYNPNHSVHKVINGSDNNYQEVRQSKKIRKSVGEIVNVFEKMSPINTLHSTPKRGYISSDDDGKSELD